MIWDCFTFYNEKEILRIRFEELDEVVDRFLIVEGTKTFRGHLKPLVWDTLRGEFKRWADRVVHVVVDDFPDGDDPWEREGFQRDAIMRGLTNADDDDIIIVSDADEIPRATAITALQLHEKPVYLDVDLYYMNFNWRVPKDWNQGGRPLVVKKKFLQSPQQLRSTPPEILIPNAGWHFSYFGGAEFIQNKISSFSHSELDLEEYTNRQHLEACAQNGTDPYRRFLLEPSEVDDTYPRWVQENISQLSHLLR